MWTNSMLKQNAWNSLKAYYWTAFGVTLLTGILGGNSSSGFSFPSGAGSSNSSYDSSQVDMSSAELIGFMIGFLVVFVFIMAFAMAVYAFLGGVVRCGECKFFCKARTGDVNFGYLFDNFQGGRYMKTVKVMFNTYLKIFLWSLLLLIPGYIKTYEYYLVAYLMSENADLSKERAQEISRRTMDGEKWKLFVLQLSFFGWFLLGAIACGLGVLFVMPYYEATMAEFYTCMRAKMLSFGITSEEELAGFYNNYDNYQNYNMNQPQNNPYDNQSYQNPNQYTNNPVYPNDNYQMPDVNDNNYHVNLNKDDYNNPQNY